MYLLSTRFIPLSARIKELVLSIICAIAVKCNKNIAKVSCGITVKQ